MRGAISKSGGNTSLAEESRRRERISVSAMISLETIGFYSDVPGSQKYPPILGYFYPTRGDFIRFVGTRNPVIW